MSFVVRALAVGLVAACGCGGAEPAPEAEPVEVASTSGSERAPRQHSDVEVSGTLGTIPQRAIDERFEMKQQAFLRCFFDGSENLDVLGGRIEFYLRIANDGSVRWAIPRASTVGDRATERCLLGLVARMKFPAPQGGDEAEFAKAIEVDAAAARPLVAWDASRVSSAVSQGSGSIAACGEGGFTVTAYVAPGGQVLAAGVAIADERGLDALDCVADAVKGWAMPDPGSYPAKVTFAVQ
jgi:hypothetical protein